MVATLDRDREKYIQTNKSLGIIGSSLEHLVLEQLFATNGEEGFSAVKAIQVANQEGQKIFTITQDNYQEIIPQLNLAPAAIADIESAAKAGYTITTHQNRISLNGYTGEGYIILDSSGNGAWMINGGMYGGYFTTLDAIVFASNVYIVDFNAERMLGSLPTDMSRVFGSIFAGLGIGSNILDLWVRYDGTAECFNFLFAAFVVEITLALIAVWFKMGVGMAFDLLNIGFHWLITENYTLHCQDQHL